MKKIVKKIMKVLCWTFGLPAMLAVALGMWTENDKTYTKTVKDLFYE